MTIRTVTGHSGTTRSSVAPPDREASAHYEYVSRWELVPVLRLEVSLSRPVDRYFPSTGRDQAPATSPACRDVDLSAPEHQTCIRQFNDAMAYVDEALRPDRPNGPSPLDAVVQLLAAHDSLQTLCQGEVCIDHPLVTKLRERYFSALSQIEEPVLIEAIDELGMEAVGSLLFFDKRNPDGSGFSISLNEQGEEERFPLIAYEVRSTRGG